MIHLTKRKENAFLIRPVTMMKGSFKLRTLVHEEQSPKLREKSLQIEEKITEGFHIVTQSREYPKTFLKRLNTNMSNQRSKQGEFEVCSQSQVYDISGFMGAKKVSIKDRDTVTDCYRLCKRVEGEDKSYGKVTFDCPELLY